MNIIWRQSELWTSKYVDKLLDDRGGRRQLKPARDGSPQDAARWTIEKQP